MYYTSSSHNSSPNYISEEHEHEWPLYDDPYYIYSNYEQEHEDEHESSRKRTKFSYEDRLTNLPDGLISHILSLMPVDAILRTQLLSKQWRYAWASSPVLTFSQTWSYVSNTSNNEFITNTLMLHKGKLKSLSLFGIEGYNGLEPPTNLWVQCAVNKQIEVLVLQINEKSYSLPHCFFVCDSLREISLSACKFDLGSSLFWKSLKKLSLAYIRNLSNDKIHKIIEGSPELESFILSHCVGFDRITVSSGSKLRDLAIKYGDRRQSQEYNIYGIELDERDDEMLEISGPSIRSLEISGSMWWMDCRLEDVSSLVRVNLRFYISERYGDNLENYSSRALKMMHQLICKISHVEELSLGTWCTQVLSMCELGGEPTMPLQCKTLEIVSLNERSIPGIARLLRSSYYLEKLTIDTEPTSRACHQVENAMVLLDVKGENYWKTITERADFMNPWQQHLKVVQFKGLFDGREREYMVELAEYILNHANILEKLVLKPDEGAYGQRSRSRSSDFRDSSLFQVMQKLLGCPRSSPHARVLLV